MKTKIVSRTIQQMEMDKKKIENLQLFLPYKDVEREVKDFFKQHNLSVTGRDLKAEVVTARSEITRDCIDQLFSLFKQAPGNNVVLDANTFIFDADCEMSLLASIGVTKEGLTKLLDIFSKNLFSRAQHTAVKLPDFFEVVYMDGKPTLRKIQ